MADTRKIEYTLVKIPKRNQICGNVLIYINERHTAKLMLMLLYANRAIPLSNLLEACQCIWSASIPYCCLGRLLGTKDSRRACPHQSIKYRYGHKIPLCVYRYGFFVPVHSCNSDRKSEFRPGLSLCGWRDVEIQELADCFRLKMYTLQQQIFAAATLVVWQWPTAIMQRSLIPRYPHTDFRDASKDLT